VSLFRSRLPANVRHALALEPGERVLAHAATPTGGHVVATDRALHLAPYLHETVRLPWQRVDRAGWDETDLWVLGTDGTEHRVTVPVPGLLPETVRERVTASIVASRYVRLGGRGGVRLVARRAPGDDVLEWEFVFDRGLDPDDPGLRALAEQALEEVRRSLGV